MAIRKGTAVTISPDSKLVVTSTTEYSVLGLITKALAQSGTLTADEVKFEVK